MRRFAPESGLQEGAEASSPKRDLRTRGLALVVLEQSQWPMVKLVAEKIASAVNAAKPGTFAEIAVSFQE